MAFQSAMIRSMEKDLAPEDVSELEHRQSQRRRGPSDGNATNSLPAGSVSNVSTLASDPAATPKPVAQRL